MSGSIPLRPLQETDVVPVAAGAGLVSGLLSLIGPYLVSLTGALAAIAFAGWVAALAEPRTGRWTLRRWKIGLALGALAVGALLFLAPPPVLLRFRALPLAGSLLPLWWTASPGLT